MSEKLRAAWVLAAALAGLGCSNGMVTSQPAPTFPALSATLVHGGADFIAGTNGVYTITVSNTGDAATSQPITLSDILPAGLTLVSGVGTGWTCPAPGLLTAVVSCTNPGPLAINASTTITLTVAVGSAAIGSVENQVIASTVGNSAATSAAFDMAAVYAAPCPTGAEAMLAGQSYAFLVSGFDANGPVTMAGSFAAATSGIAGGLMDVNRAAASGGPQTNLFIEPGVSTYTMDANGHGCLNLVNSAGSSFSSGNAFSFRFSLGPAPGGNLTRGRMTLFTDTTGTGLRGSGILRMQTASAFTPSAFNNDWVFLLTGGDGGGGQFAVGGNVIATSGAPNGTFNVLAADSNDAGTLRTNVNGNTGTYVLSQPTEGRGTGTLVAGSLNLGIAYYMVGPGEVIAMSTDPIARNPICGGEFLAATLPAQPNLAGNYMLETTGDSAVTGAQAQIGTVQFQSGSGTSAGTMNGTAYVNAAGVPSTQSLSSAYAVNLPTGRVTLAQAGYPVLYPTNTGNGAVFAVGTDSAATSGVFDFQSSGAPAFGNVTLAGQTLPFAAGDNTDRSVVNEDGYFAFAGATGLYTGVEDQSTATGLVASQALAATPYLVHADGSGNLGGNLMLVTNGATLFLLDLTPGQAHPQIVIAGF